MDSNVIKILDSLTDEERKLIEDRFGKIPEDLDFNIMGSEWVDIRHKIREIEKKALKKLTKLNSEPPDGQA